MKKSFSLKTLITVTAFGIAASVLITCMVFQSALISAEKEVAGSYSAKADEILELVDKYYMGEVDDSAMADSIASGAVAGLGDKYSSYITAQNASTRFDTLYGYNTGLGVQVSLHPDNGSIVVLELHDDGPAKASGIKVLDEITAVDGKNVTEVGYNETLQYIKEQAIGTVITVTVDRNGESSDIPVELKHYDAQTVFSRLVGDKGYIQITSFNEKSPDQFKTAVDSMIASGATALIFDLRGNGGGTVTSVSSMLDYLLPEGLILKIEYKDKNSNEVYMSDKSSVDIPMAVLTDEGTASASEIFTQSLRDYGKAVIVGRQTYGKGVVQRTFTLSDGSLAVLTVAHYYTQSGYCPEGQGITPDVQMTWTQDELKYRLVGGIEKDKEFIAACDYLDSASNQPS